MSKKTENIYKAISHLDDLRNEISIIAKMAKLDVSNEDSDENGRSERIRHLENIEFEMNQDIKSLKFWIGSLYLYNGKSTSRAKTEASKENGKKGGRPPKQITEAKKRIKELEEIILPEAEHRRNLTVDFEEERYLEVEIEKGRNERDLLRSKVEQWEKSKVSG